MKVIKPLILVQYETQSTAEGGGAAYQPRCFGPVLHWLHQLAGPPITCWSAIIWPPVSKETIYNIWSNMSRCLGAKCLLNIGRWYSFQTGVGWLSPDRSFSSAGQCPVDTTGPKVFSTTGQSHQTLIPIPFLGHFAFDGALESICGTGSCGRGAIFCTGKKKGCVLIFCLFFWTVLFVLCSLCYLPLDFDDGHFFITMGW